MKTILTVLTMMFSIAAFSQKTISLNPEISIQIPENATAFDDKVYKESLKSVFSGAAFIRYTKDIYKIDDIVIRIIVMEGNLPPDFIEKEKKSSYYYYHSHSGYHSTTSSFKGNEQIITGYSTKNIGHYTSYIYNFATKMGVKIEMQYQSKDAEKKKAGEILNGISESVNFK